MKYETLVIGVLASVATLSSAARAQDTVRVQSSLVRFELPVGRSVDSSWHWYRPTTPDNRQEYGWIVRIPGDPGHEIGFYLFKFPGSLPKSGSFSQLLRAGQSSVFTGGQRGQRGQPGQPGQPGQLVKRFRPSLKGAGETLLIAFSDSRAIAEFFRARPTSVTLELTSPYQDRMTKRVPVVYDDASVRPTDASQGVAQWLRPEDVAAIERAAVEYVAKSLPKGDIGFDPDIVRENRWISRDAAQIHALAQALGARVVRADSVYTCGKGPSTCTLGVAALVRVGEPVATPDGARVWVEVRRHSGFDRQPVSRGSDELVLAKQDGSWKVVGVARRNTS